MAASDVFICNLALQALGQPAITALTENSVAARECNRCYEHLRDLLVTTHRWHFAEAQDQIAAESTAPSFGYAYAFPWPSDCLRPLPPNDYTLDWKMQGRKILSDDSGPLDLIYLKRVADTAQFPATFTQYLALKMAHHMCEKLTQSNTKKASLAEDIREARAEAKKANDFADLSPEPPEDAWISAMR